MGLTLANECKFIAGDQIDQRIRNGPEQACRAAISAVLANDKVLCLRIPFEPLNGETRVKYLIYCREIYLNTGHCSIHRGSGAVAKPASLVQQSLRRVSAFLRDPRKLQPAHYAAIVAQAIMAGLSHAVFAVDEIKRKIISQKWGISRVIVSTHSNL